MPKQIVLTDFLTAAEINQAARLYRTAAPGTFAKTVCEKFIQPNIERINAALKQENDPMYLAYAVEYVMMSAVKL